MTVIYVTNNSGLQAGIFSRSMLYLQFLPNSQVLGRLPVIQLVKEEIGAFCSPAYIDTPSSETAEAQINSFADLAGEVRLIRQVQPY